MCIAQSFGPARVLGNSAKYLDPVNYHVDKQIVRAEQSAMRTPQAPAVTPAPQAAKQPNAMPLRRRGPASALATPDGSSLFGSMNTGSGSLLGG